MATSGSFPPPSTGIDDTDPGINQSKDYSDRVDANGTLVSVQLMQGDSFVATQARGRWITDKNASGTMVTSTGSGATGQTVDGKSFAPGRVVFQTVGGANDTLIRDAFTLYEAANNNEDIILSANAYGDLVRRGQVQLFYTITRIAPFHLIGTHDFTIDEQNFRRMTTLDNPGAPATGGEWLPDNGGGWHPTPAAPVNPKHLSIICPPGNYHVDDITVHWENNTDPDGVTWFVWYKDLGDVWHFTAVHADVTGVSGDLVLHVNADCKEITISSHNYPHSDVYDWQLTEATFTGTE